MHWPTGTGRVVLGSTDSTNTQAAARAADAPLWVLAHEQTAGRGRRARAWSTPSGNFAASYVMQAQGPVRDLGLMSFVAALALYDALVSVGVSPVRLSLKWPNDVLLDGGKLAGILLETHGAGPSHLILGIGVNLVHAPAPEMVEQGALPGRTLANDADLDLKAEDLLAHLAIAFDLRHRQMFAAGFGAIRNDWLARAARIGDEVTARLPKETVTGLFETVDEDGAIVIDTGLARRHIHAGDIFFETE